MRTHLLYLVIIAAVTILLGLYLITSTVVIAQDGAGFIGFAKGLRSNFSSTVIGNYQHPGYPVLIELIQPLFVWAGGLQSWIYSAQAVSLTCKLLAVIILYFVGVNLVGARYSFIGSVLLVLLPECAVTGSDALSEWPHLLFFSAGFFMLLKWCRNPHWAWAGLAGLFGGAGYLVRPECVQIVTFGVILLCCGLFISEIKQTKKAIALSLFVLIAAFLAAALPYMHFKGAFFPKKSLDLQIVMFSQYFPTASIDAVGFAGEFAAAFYKLFVRTSELMGYFFWPFWVLGIVIALTDKKRNMLHRILVGSAVTLTVAVLVWLYARYGYIARRHLLPLAAMTIWFVPIGIEWVCSKLAMIKEAQFFKLHRGFVFVGIIVTGIIVCLPKSLKPIGKSKAAYLDVVSWLRENSQMTDAVLAPDVRIGFYAERKVFVSADDVRGERIYYVTRNQTKAPKGYVAKKRIRIPASDGIVYTMIACEKKRRKK